MTRILRAITLLPLAVFILNLGGPCVVVRWSDWTVKARRAKVRHDLKAIVHEAECYRVQHGAYPADLLFLNGVNDGKEPLFGSTVDPWGREYLYDLGVNGRPRVRCLGSDGAPGGSGEAADLEEPGPEEGG